MVPVARKIKKVEGLEAHQDLARGFIGGSGGSTRDPTRNVGTADCPQSADKN